MTAQQRIVRVRRNYNQWVANQTLEDYALRFTAKSARKWSSFRVANTAIGAVSFLALEAIGGSITINYGFINATSAILVGRRADLPDRPADRLLRRDLRRRHRSAHPRRRLRLYRLDDHVADLRLLHLPLLRHRGGDHVARAGNVFRHAAVRRLRASVRWSSFRWSRTASPSSAASSCGRSRSGSCCISCRSSSSRSRTSSRSDDGPHFPGSRKRGRAIVQPRAVRHRRDRGVLADRADRRAGRLPALSAAARQTRAPGAGGPPICRPGPAGSCPAC